MKKFLSENWYKLLIGSSFFMASFGFMVQSISPVMAGGSNEKSQVHSNYRLIQTNADGSINVKLSDEQLNKIIPKNEDGSIHVKFDQSEILSVNLRQIGGTRVAWYEMGNGAAALWTRSAN